MIGNVENVSKHSFGWKPGGIGTFGAGGRLAEPWFSTEGFFVGRRSVGSWRRQDVKVPRFLVLHYTITFLVFASSFQ